MKYLGLLLLFFILPADIIAQDDFSACRESFEEGKFGKAAKCFSKKMRANASSSEAYLGRADCYYALGKLESAVNDYSQVIKMDPNNRESLGKRAGAYFKLEKYELAILDYSKLIELGVKRIADMYFLRGIAKSLLKVEDVDGACADFRKAKELGIDMRQLKGMNKYCDTDDLE